MQTAPSTKTKAAKTTKGNDTSIVPLVQEAERFLTEAIKHFKLSCDPKAIVVTIQTAGRKNARGWYWGKRWNCGNTTINEINLCAEHLRGDMAELLLHELAHAENAHNKIKDCTSTQVHNKKFKVMAEALGLTVKPRDKRYGFAFTELGEVAKAFVKSVKFNQDLFTMTRLGEPGKTKKPGSRLRLWMCKCGIKLRVASDDLNCTCNECDSLFVNQTAETEDGE